VFERDALTGIHPEPISAVVESTTFTWTRPRVNAQQP